MDRGRKPVCHVLICVCSNSEITVISRHGDRCPCMPCDRIRIRFPADTCMIDALRGTVFTVENAAFRPVDPDTEIKSDGFRKISIEIMKLHRFKCHRRIHSDVAVRRSDQLCGDDVLIIAAFEINTCSVKIYLFIWIRCISFKK